MGIRGGFPIAGGGHNACGFVRVAVGVLKHSQGKQFRQGAGHGTVQCFIRQGQFLFGKAFRKGVGFIITIFAAVVGFHAGFVIKQAADDIHACIGHGKADALRHIQHLNAPGHVVGNAGIGVDVAVKPHLTAQHGIDKILVVGEAIRFHFHGIAC